MKIKIKTNEDLFNKWVKLIRFSEPDIIALVQNDMELEYSEVLEWRKRVKLLIKKKCDEIEELKALERETLLYINSLNWPKENPNKPVVKKVVKKVKKGT